MFVENPMYRIYIRDYVEYRLEYFITLVIYHKLREQYVPVWSWVQDDLRTIEHIRDGYIPSYLVPRVSL